MELKEKEVISDIATVGIYYFSKGSEYVQYSKAFLKFQNRMKEDSYAKQYGFSPLMFVHN